MALKLPAAGGGDFAIPEEGNLPAVLTGIIQLGTHEVEFQGRVKQVSKAMFVSELTDQPDPIRGGNQVIGQEFTLSRHEKSSLYQSLLGVGRAPKDGEEFALDSLLGMKFEITITHHQSAKGRTYARAGKWSKVRKGAKVPPAKLKPYLYEIGGADPLPTVDWLPYSYGEPVQEVIRRSPEWKAAYGQARPPAQEEEGELVPAGGAPEDDFPGF